MNEEGINTSRAVKMDPKNTYERNVFSGWVTDLPQLESSAVRVFFSSTFTDMTTERNLLMKEAVPYLRDYCRSKRLDFQVVDMRWGIPEDASTEHTTINLCLQEIHNCQLTSCGPNFVAFLGDRYGTRMLPNAIGVSEFHSLRRMASWLNEKDFSVVEHWYWLDTNAVPAVYQIQPITSLLPYYANKEPANNHLHVQHQRSWDRDQRMMIQILRRVAREACSRKMISDEEHSKYYISVTHMEMINGIVKSNSADKVLCFNRTLNDINVKDSLAKRYIDMTEEDKVDAEVQDLCRKLKSETVPSYLSPSNIINKSVLWNSRGITDSDPAQAAYLQEFCETFKSRMVDMINDLDSNLLPACTIRKELYSEVLNHLHFCRQKCEIFFGREDFLKEICSNLDKLKIIDEEDNGKEVKNEMTNRKSVEVNEESPLDRVIQENNSYISNLGITFCHGDTFDDFDSDPARNMKEEYLQLPEIKTFRRPFVIHGSSGSGKTALMAKLVQMSKIWIPQSVCVVRFMGTTASSSNIREVLLSVVTQLLELYGKSAPASIDLGVDFHYLTLYLSSLLWKIDTISHPLFLILDSVDQLQTTDYAHSLTWLPKMVPPNVHLFVSMLTDHSVCLNNARSCLPFAEQYIELGPLDRFAADKMIRAICHRASRTLTASQRTCLLQKFLECSQALYLKLITDQALSWQSHMSVKDIPSTVEMAIEELFNRLEKNHGCLLVAKALGYLTLAKQGVSDGEMEDLLSLDDEVLQDTYLFHLPPDPSIVRLPPSLWVRVKNDVREYLAQQHCGNVEVYTWYHRHFKVAALQRYGSNASKVQLHKTMAEYFLGTWSDKPKPLELFKVKKGSYPDCHRGVPAQPLSYQGTQMYNVRKLQEAPHHLVESQNWKTFHHTVACNIHWLIGSCEALGASSLLDQFSAMLAKRDCSGEDVEEIVKDINLVYNMIKLGIDAIRHDSINLPVQIVSQLGWHYKGSAAIEQLIHDCLKYMETVEKTLMVPQNAFLPAPGGVLLYSINVQVHLLGADRVNGQSIFLDEDKKWIYLTEWTPNGQPDKLLILDYANAGTIIAQEKLTFFVHSLYFAGNKRFIIMEVYEKLDKYSPVFNYALFEGSLSTPYVFAKSLSALSVASHGQEIAFSYVKDSCVNIGIPDTKTCSVIIQYNISMDTAIAVLLFSPDTATLLVVDDKSNMVVWSTTQKITSPLTTCLEKERFLFHTPLQKEYCITMSSLLLFLPQDVSSKLVVFDLKAGEEKGQLSSEILSYKISLIELDKYEEFVIVASSEGVISNGKISKPALVWRLSDLTLASHVPSIEPWQAVKLIGDEVLTCLAACSSVGVIRIFSIGPRTAPYSKAQLVTELNEHSVSVFELFSLQQDTELISVATDNTLKVWDLKRILKEQQSRSMMEEKQELNIEHNTMKCLLDEKISLGKTVCLAIANDDSQVFFGTDKGVVACTKLNPYEDYSVICLASDLPAVHLMCMAKSGSNIIVAAKNILAVFDCITGKLRYKRESASTSKVSCLAEGGGIAVAGHSGMEGRGLIWNLETGETIRTVGFLYAFSHTAVNSIGSKLVTHMFEFPFVLDVYEEQGSKMRMDEMDIMMSGCTCIVISPNDMYVAACASDGSIRVVSMENKYLHRFQQRSSPITAIFSSDSQLLLSGGFRSIYVWTMGSGQLKCKLTRHQNFVTSLQFVMNDRFLVSASLDQMALVCDFTNHTTVSSVQAHCQLHTARATSNLSHLIYIPDRIASLAMLCPNLSLKENLENRKPKAIPKSLEQAQAFAFAFSSQSYPKTNTAYAVHNTSPQSPNTSTICAVQ